MREEVPPNRIHTHANTSPPTSLTRQRLLSAHIGATEIYQHPGFLPSCPQSPALCPTSSPWALLSFLHILISLVYCCSMSGEVIYGRPWWYDKLIYNTEASARWMRSLVPSPFSSLFSLSATLSLLPSLSHRGSSSNSIGNEIICLSVYLWRDMAALGVSTLLLWELQVKGHFTHSHSHTFGS